MSCEIEDCVSNNSVTSLCAWSEARDCRTIKRILFLYDFLGDNALVGNDAYHVCSGCKACG